MPGGINLNSKMSSLIGSLTGKTFPAATIPGPAAKVGTTNSYANASTVDGFLSGVKNGQVSLTGSGGPNSTFVLMVPVEDPSTGQVTMIPMGQGAGGVPTGSAAASQGYSGGPPGPPPANNPHNPASIAASFLGPNGKPGRAITSLIGSGSSTTVGPYLQSFSSDATESCANFVSACLQASGQLPPGTHSNGVVALGGILRSSGKFRSISPSEAQPGDVILMGSPQHAVMVYSNVGGKISIIGSNNCGPGGTQEISVFPLFGSGDQFYHYTG
jgi:hypothetical protein